jgi:ubiquitin C-terminal hydrolase
MKKLEVNFSHKQLSMKSTMELTQKKGLVGLQNMGLTCYANATLQCLRNLPRVSWLFTSGRFDSLFDKSPKSKRKLQQDVCQSFADLIHQQNQGQHPGIMRPAGFWNVTHDCLTDSVYEHMKVKAPHDSHEFLMFMIECLHEGTSMEVEMQIMKQPPQTESEKRIVQALETWKSNFSKEYSPLVDMFYGLLHFTTTCTECKNPFHRWEPFNTLKAAGPKRTAELDANPPSLLSLIADDMKAEVIEGYSCDKCAPNRHNADRKVAIWRLPQNLVICLKRFTPDGQKIHTKVAVDQILDMQSLFSEESPEKTAITKYELRGVIDHHGGSRGGHYTAQVKEPVSSNWVIFDDESVLPIAQPHFGESTYILFYERASSK